MYHIVFSNYDKFLFEYIGLCTHVDGTERHCLENNGYFLSKVAAVCSKLVSQANNSWVSNET